MRTNSEADGDLLKKVAAPDSEGRQLLTRAAERLKLSARSYHRVMRVARTLADMDGSDGVKRIHIAEALSYRRIAIASRFMGEKSGTTERAGPRDASKGSGASSTCAH